MRSLAAAAPRDASTPPGAAVRMTEGLAAKYEQVRRL
jgi:hypothetical protein